MIIPFRRKFEEVFASQRRWYKKYLWFLLFLMIFSVISVIPAFIKEGLRFPKKELLSAVGLFLFISTGLFLFMVIGDTVKQSKNIFLKIFVLLFVGIGFLVWLVISVLWISNILVL
jgi:hypothetical protein